MGSNMSTVLVRVLYFDDIKSEVYYCLRETSHKSLFLKKYCKGTNSATEKVTKSWWIFIKICCFSFVFWWQNVNSNNSPLGRNNFVFYIKVVISRDLGSITSIHESLVSQVRQVVRGAQVPLRFLCLQALQVALAHQDPPGSMTEPDTEKNTSESDL